MYFSRGPTSLALMALTWAHGTLGQSSREESPKPSTCEGVLMVQSKIPAITGVNGKPFEQFVGNLTYSLSMNGTLSLNSTVPTWHCSAIETRSNSTSTMRTLQNLFASAQLTCNSEPMDIDSPYLTEWSKISFSGQVYVSIIAHDGICASPPTLLSTGSTCFYNTTTDSGLRGSQNEVCSWTSKDDQHHAGDAQAGAGQDSEG